ncbi:MAG: hypothetical protein N3B10_09405 [Armatimonadetes bacterium]|nr:hypothetical protein [Armatimonadota bacterium]
MEQFSRLPSPARSQFDPSTLPCSAIPSQARNETLPSPVKHPEQSERAWK